MVLPADAGRAQVCWPADDPDHPGWNRRRTSTGQWSDWRVVGSGFAGVPPGLIEIFPMVAIPPRRLKCNGAAVSRTAYAELFAAIGTTYGEGDGSLTFNIPDLRGEFVRGWDDGRGVDAGRTLGSAQADSVRSHTHTGRLSHAWGGTNNDTASNRVAFGGTTSSGYPALVIDAFGGAETRSRNVALIYTIAY
jgi:phage-related tail fiber protein